MKTEMTIDEKIRDAIRRLRLARAELRKNRANPPPRPNLTEDFLEIFRDAVKGTPDRLTLAEGTRQKTR